MDLVWVGVGVEQKLVLRKEPGVVSAHDASA